MGFLKLLELENFKSYKGHQVVGPFKKFTAIIGPNGSGKSNLMDAISFVLGERTQNLRVRSLKDLIHGAPIGKPVATRAKVVLVYQEEDDSETTFARIIIGSSSEYRLNGKVVSQTQYQNKLESIGIFLKAKNCLVFQGAVESIAMKTPKERTQLFEEISGSGEHASEYEQKKVAMTQAQEDTTLSYQKKKAIVSEKKEAKAEKEEAERYKKLQEEYDEARLQEQLFHLYHSEQRIESTSSQIRDKQRELDKLSGQRGKLENELKAKKSEAAKWSREVALIEKKLREKEVEINKAKPLYIKAKEKTSHVAKRLEANKKVHLKAVAKEKQHRESVESLELELADVKARSREYEEEVASASQEEDLQLRDSQMSEYYRLQAHADKKSASLTQDLERLELEKRTDVESFEAFKMKREELTNRQKQLVDQRELQEERIERIDSFISTNTQVINQLRNDEEKLSSEMSQASTRHQELSDALGKVQREISELDGDRHENKRRQRSAETLENLKRLYPGVYGKVVELCEPVHSRFSVAVTKALGRNLEAVVVDLEKTGRDCIQYLKEQRVEPMTFIPLDTVDVSPINESYRSLGGSSKLVYDIIKYDPPTVARAIQFACGNSIVCDTMEEARRVAYHGERKRVVSLDGTLFQKNGIISGGTTDTKTKAKAFDEKKVDLLARKRDRYIKELKEVVEVQRKDPELRTIRAKISTLEMRLKHSKRDKQLSEEQTLPSISRELEAIQGELAALEPRMAKYQASIDKRSASIAKLQSKIDKLEDEVFRDFCQSIGIANIRDFQEKQVRAKELRAKKRLEFSELISRLQNQLDFEQRKNPAATVAKHARTIRDDESSITALREDEQEKLEGIEELEAEVEELQEKRRAIKSKTDQKDIEMGELRKMLGGEVRGITQLQKKINTLETELDQQRADRHSLLKSCKMDDIKIPMEQGSMDDIGDDVPSLSNQSESVGTSTQFMDIDSMSSQGARVLYEREAQITIDYTHLERRLKQVSDAGVREMGQELNGKLLKLQSTLERFTAPNLRALEKLEGVEARLQETSEAFEHYRHLSKKTKTEFEHVKKMRFEKFSDALDHVAGEIDQIYKQLSNNSSAQAFISADNAEEPYLEGISYNCIAPGKRFRPMDNLSGGEKTVAALALLFAIHGYQSAPFFVLDEIDAALDNTNINRVARYIVSQTGEGSFQCVVISLKEEFYSHADALIGIYSEVGGECTVSETVTLDLSKYPETSGSPLKARAN